MLTSLTHQTRFRMVVRSLSLSPSILFAFITLGFLLGSVSANCQGCSPPTLVIKVRTPIFCSNISVL